MVFLRYGPILGQAPAFFDFYYCYWFINFSRYQKKGKKNLLAGLYLRNK